jgi:hypothetical protein
MIKLEAGGTAPVLRYNIPEPTSYPGRNVIELDIDESLFKPELRRPPGGARFEVADPASTRTAVLASMRSGFADKRVFSDVGGAAASVRLLDQPNPELVAVGTTPISTKLASLNPEEVVAMLQSGKKLNIYRSLYGTLTYNYVEQPKVARPTLLLIESYRLSSFLGDYGAGRTIKTFTLLPGEQTKIAVKSYTKTQVEAKSASSILDSFTEESAEDFEDSLQSEQSDKRSSETSKEFHAEAGGGASWGWGSAKASAGFKKGSHIGREQFAKNVSSATRKHASKASAKRDVQINTSYEVSQESGQETSVEREIENINRSRVLNFVFRQMNQQFLTVLHLVDVRVGFFNGFAESRREYPLPQLDVLLDEVMVDNAANKATVKDSVVEQLRNVFDHDDRRISVVEEKDLGGGDKYLRFKKDLKSAYTDPESGIQVEVPGVILSAVTSVMRTEGVLVEALLGDGPALDTYATRLQELEVERREAEVSKANADAKRAALINELTENNDAARAKILADLICPCGPTPPLTATQPSPVGPEG